MKDKDPFKDPDLLKKADIDDIDDSKPIHPDVIEALLEVILELFTNQNNNSGSDTLANKSFPSAKQWYEFIGKYSNFIRVCHRYDLLKPRLGYLGYYRVTELTYPRTIYISLRNHKANAAKQTLRACFQL